MVPRHPKVKAMHLVSERCGGGSTLVAFDFRTGACIGGWPWWSDESLDWEEGLGGREGLNVCAEHLARKGSAHRYVPTAT